MRLLITAMCLLAGCAADPFRSVIDGQHQSTVELHDTVFFPQDAYQCGPAALATMLVAAGVSTTPELLLPFLFIPERRGSIQAEMISTSRRFGRVPYAINPSFAELLQELDEGRPVLILQNLGVSWAPLWHYAVVIGYSRQKGEIILRSGSTKRLVLSARTFVSTWRRSDYWALVLLRPDDIPATVDATRYLKSIAAAEGAGQFDLALTAYSNALQRWPNQDLALLGLANSLYATGDFDGAELQYRQLLKANTNSVVGMNNLASLLAERGHCDEAKSLTARAFQEVTVASPYYPLLLQTESEARQCR